MVGWLVNQIPTLQGNRFQATTLGRRMLVKGLIRHAANDSGIFEDKYQYYCFNNDVVPYWTVNLQQLLIQMLTSLNAAATNRNNNSSSLPPLPPPLPPPVPPSSLPSTTTSNPITSPFPFMSSNLHALPRNELSFLGTECVTWFVQHVPIIQQSREAAVFLGQRLLSYGYIVAMSGVMGSRFADRPSYYTLTAEAGTLAGIVVQPAKIPKTLNEVIANFPPVMAGGSASSVDEKEIIAQLQAAQMQAAQMGPGRDIPNPATVSRAQA